MFEIIIDFIREIVALELFNAFMGTLCFLVLLGLKMFIHKKRGE